MTFDIKLIFFLNTFWEVTPLCKFSSSRPQWLIFLKILNFRSFRFFAPKNRILPKFLFLKLWPKDIQRIVHLAKSQVSDPSGSIFKKFPKIAYTLTLQNERPVIKLPIGVHYQIFIDICCVDTDFGSTDQRSRFCGLWFGCKKIKSLFKNFFNAIQ